MAAADKALDTAGLQRLWSHIQAGFGDLQAQINSLEVTGDYVPLTRTINSKELSSDINLTANDIKAASLSAINENQISENSDLSTVNFLRVGTYCCANNAIAASLANCPTVVGFMMYVYAPISYSDDGQESTQNYVYRIRRIIDIQGNEYTQQVQTTSVIGEFVYYPWAQILKTNTPFITDSQNYGSGDFPANPVEGQVYFKLVT